EITGSNCFPDVNEQWFAKYICKAQSENIISGYPDGEFKPAEEINFSEAAKILANTYQISEKQEDPEIWFRNYIKALQDKKAIPLSVEYLDELITRDEMTEIIWRLETNQNQKASRTFEELTGEGLVTVNSCSELEQRLAITNSQNNHYRGDGFIELEEADFAPATTSDSVSKEAAPGGGGGAAGDFSTTNIQEEGVDEADIIKNDGKYIYLIKGNSVRIIEAYPANQLSEIISFELGEENGFNPSEMYLDGDQLTVIGNSYQPYTYSDSQSETSIYRPSSKTKVFIVDVTDKQKPKVERTVEFEGNYRDSRKIDDTLYTIVNLYPFYHYDYLEPLGEEFEETLPKMFDSSEERAKAVAECGDIRILPKPNSNNYLISAAIPLNDKTQPVDTEVLIGNAEQTYASPNNLYVARTDWNWGYRNLDQTKSKIYKFALRENEIEYVAEGEVPGTILNQFSMDEHRGNFRVATTSNSSTEQTNGVYILDENLEELGSVDGLAPDERIYSVRFMGDRGYMVTFKTVDPLFVLDLSNSSDPKVLGELKIPGFSDYLHPYDENHLIGFGKDAEEIEGQDWAQFHGFKMGLFDVSDPENPQELYTESIGERGTSSELLYNHKALLFDKEKDLIAFPITVHEYQDLPICRDFTYSTCPEKCTKVCSPESCVYEDGVKICSTDCDGPNSCVEPANQYAEPTFVGAYVYGLDLEEGFNFKGRITHLSDEEQLDLLKDGWLKDYEKQIKRIIYIGENLYTVSFSNVKVNDLETLEAIEMIDLAEANYKLHYGIPEPLIAE
ncbi:hypothetical protein GF376_02245, partial [Candidatus Peregrinibacteria bacterium]|nr:hypothetical protein [Candidatus Peregrinibacteria bacterium]